jgi:hypothetical protein
MHLRSVLSCLPALLFVTVHAQETPPPAAAPKPAPKMVAPKKKPETIKKVTAPAPAAKKAPPKAAPATVKKAPPKAAPAMAKKAPVPVGGKMEVKEAVIAREIVDRVPKEAGTEFPSDVKRLCCFTEIINGEGGEIQHRWFFNNKKVSMVPLKIKSNRYRTYSAKTIVPEMAGTWKVDIVDVADEALLYSLEFTVK